MFPDTSYNMAGMRETHQQALPALHLGLQELNCLASLLMKD